MIKGNILRIGSFILMIFTLTTCRFKDSSLEEQQTIAIARTVNYNETCEWGTEEAVKDFKAGKLMLFRYGLEVENYSPYWKALEKDYKIYVKSREGCVILPSFTCYNDYMIAKIREKYGAQFLENFSKKFNY